MHTGASSRGIDHLDAVLESLETAGLITYRDFADEYRIWQGRILTLKARSRQRAAHAATKVREPSQRGSSTGASCGRTPLPAHRYSVHFEQRFSELSDDELIPPGVNEQWDGKVLYATMTKQPEYQERLASV